MASAEYYERLDVARDASAEQIKKAYRKAALRDHPDRNPGDAAAEERFKKAAEAYAVLADPEKRARYDRFGAEGVRGSAAPNFESEVFSGLGDLLGGFFGFDAGGGRSSRGGPARGASLQYRLEIELEQAATGDEVEIRVPRQRTCSTCDGSGSADDSGATLCSGCGGHGQVQQRHGFLTIARTCHQCGGAGKIIRDPCRTCRGVGRASETTTLKVKVPAGVDNGMRLLLRGEGESGTLGGPAGDLQVLIGVREHRQFLRSENDLFTQAAASFTRLALGGQIDVPTLGGDPVVLDVPAGAQSGDVFEIAGHGMPPVNGGRRGALKVSVQAVTPRKLGVRERELLEELDELLPIPEVGGESSSWWDRLRSVFG